MTRGRWTTAAPKRAGWYWVRIEDPEPKRFYTDDRGEMGLAWSASVRSAWQSWSEYSSGGQCRVWSVPIAQPPRAKR
jgi:hypothetical protein